MITLTMLIITVTKATKKTKKIERKKDRRKSDLHYIYKE